jgi:hypothetical protein
VLLVVLNLLAAVLANFRTWKSRQVGHGTKYLRRSLSSYAASIRLMPVILGVEHRNTFRLANVRVRAIASVIGSPSPSTSPG